MLKNYEKDLVSWKENLHKDHKKVSQMHSKYLEAKIKAAHTRGKYNSLLEAFKKIDSDFKKAKAAFDACIELCNEEDPGIGCRGGAPAVFAASTANGMIEACPGSFSGEAVFDPAVSASRTGFWAKPSRHICTNSG